jgi:biopolymer transport protein TolQ
MPSSPPTIKLDVLSLLLNASGPIRLTVLVLLVAGAGVWLIAILKFLQVARLRGAEHAFERAALGANNGQELYGAAVAHRSAPGGRIVFMMATRAGTSSSERLRAIAERALVTERTRLGVLMSTLGSIAAASPFIGLFGTVYGIMDAFIRIGQEKSASLPVVAPAIGEALITTAIGLAAAIPAVIFYNAIDKRVTQLTDEIEAATEEWVVIFSTKERGEPAVPLTRPASHAPPSQGAGGAAWGSGRGG